MCIICEKNGFPHIWKFGAGRIEATLIAVALGSTVTSLPNFWGTLWPEDMILHARSQSRQRMASDLAGSSTHSVQGWTQCMAPDLTRDQTQHEAWDPACSARPCVLNQASAWVSLWEDMVCWVGPSAWSHTLCIWLDPAHGRRPGTWPHI